MFPDDTKRILESIRARLHLGILNQGIEEWNKWRNMNPEIKPDLSGTVLGEMNLSKANLIGVDLRGADLRGAHLDQMDLRNVNLSGADLTDAKLSVVNLRGANLSGAELKGANLYRALLQETCLKESDLSGAYLYNVDLWRANATKANLENADLRYGDLNQANFTGAVLTGVRLYGTARDDWQIKDVTCRYVYWDDEGKRRSPEHRDLEPDEFERLYASIPTVDYVFEHGMTPIDPLIMDRVVQTIREKRPEFDIKIDSINARGLAPSMKFTIQREIDKESALMEIRKAYETKIKQLERERDRYYEILSRALDKPQDIKLITAGPGAIVATDGSTINIQKHIHNAIELQRAIAEEPAESESFAKVAKKTALDIVGDAIKDVAKAQVKEAAKQIIELGKDLGPFITKTTAYLFFKGIGS